MRQCPPEEAARHESLHRLRRPHPRLGASARRHRRRRRHRHPGPPREAQRAHLRRLRRPARPARRAVPGAVRPGPGAGRGRPRLLLRRRRRRDHRRHPRHGHRPAPGLQPDDRPGGPRDPRVPVPRDRGAARRGRGSGSGPRPGRGLPRRRPHRPLRLPVHPRRSLRRGHGCGLPPAPRRRPGPRDPPADAGRPGPGPRGGAHRPDQRTDGGGRRRRDRTTTGPPPGRGPGSGVRPDQGAAHVRTGHAPGGLDRTRRLDPGPPDDGEDYAEFHAAFTEKRPPKWSGR